MARADVLIVSLGSTAGLRAAAPELRGALERVGARVALAAAAPQRDVRTLALTDLLWARAAAPPRAPLFASTSRGDHLLDDDRGAPVAGARRDSLRRPVGGQPPRPPRRLAAPAERRRLRHAAAGAVGGRLAGGGATAARARGRRADPRRAAALDAPGRRAPLRGDHLRRQPAQEGPRPR